MHTYVGADYLLKDLRKLVRYGEKVISTSTSFYKAPTIDKLQSAINRISKDDCIENISAYSLSLSEKIEDDNKSKEIFLLLFKNIIPIPVIKIKKEKIKAIIEKKIEKIEKIEKISKLQNKKNNGVDKSNVNDKITKKIDIIDNQNDAPKIEGRENIQNKSNNNDKNDFKNILQKSKKINDINENDCLFDGIFDGVWKDVTHNESKESGGKKNKKKIKDVEALSLPLPLPYSVDIGNYSYTCIYVCINM
jgi:hypothetical protein